MKILAVDMATKSGWAINTNAGIISGTENMKKKTTESRGMVFIRFEAWLEEMIKLHKPKLVVYERPHARGRAANEVLNGMLAFLVKLCETHSIDYSDCPSTTLKKFATGRGSAGKPEMIAMCKSLYNIAPIDDNEADALHLLHWAKQEFGG